MKDFRSIGKAYHPTRRCRTGRGGGRPIAIRVDGRPLTAFAGDTVLAALHAAGIMALRRSDRSGAPRGALCGMGVCFECRVTVDGRPGVQACMTEVKDGMEIETDGA